MMRTTVWFLVACSCLATAAGADEPAQRRAALLALPPGPDSIPALQAGLADPDLVTARAAARRLADCGPTAIAALGEAMQREDPLLRRAAVAAAAGLGEAAAPLVVGALSDPAPLVRQAALLAIARVGLPAARVSELLAVGVRDEVGDVAETARLMARAVYATQTTIRLPAAGWKFRLDPERVGRDQNWFTPDLADADWLDISIEQTWQNAGHDYIGVTWYRRTIELPADPGGQRVEIRFHGVDESTWVWLNGQYVGEHDIGPVGWDKPFSLDVTDLVRWGQPNQFTIRAMNTAHAGGIWRPVELVVLGAAPATN